MSQLVHLGAAAALAGRAAAGDVGAGEGVQAAGAGKVNADMAKQGLRVAGRQRGSGRGVGGGVGVVRVGGHGGTVRGTVERNNDNNSDRGQIWIRYA